MEKKGFTLFNMPWQMFCFISVIVLIAAYIGVLPVGMAGCFVFMIVVGTWLDLIGNKTPIINSYFGGGAIVVLFGVARLAVAVVRDLRGRHASLAGNSRDADEVLAVLVVEK